MIGARVYRIRSDVVHRALDDEHYLLSADNAFHTVSDPVGTFVLGLLARGPGRTLAEIVEFVRSEFDADQADVEDDVRTFLGSLVTLKILETTAPEGEE